MKGFNWLILTALLLSAASLPAQIPSDPSVRRGVLDNGMHYYIQYNAKPEKRAELRLAVHAGSMQEDEDQLGLAHFVEHMAFNGSTNFKKSELVDYLETVGTRFGPDLNAYTSFDETVYMLQARTDSLDLLLKGLLILQDWAGGVAFEGEEIDKERGVVVSEWRTRLSGEQRMQQKYFPVMYQGSRYATRLPIGEPAIIEGAEYETVRRFYRDWYRPDLMAVIVVGDFEVDMMEKEIKSRFSQLKNPATSRPREVYEVPKHAETLVSICSDKEAAFTNVQLMYKHDHKEVKTLDDYRALIVRSLYNNMLNSRLQELTQQPDPPFNYGYTFYGNDVGKLDTYQSFAMAKEGEALRALQTLLTENKRVLDHGFTATELERQKVEMITNVERAFKEADKTESGRLVSRYIYNFLEGYPFPSPAQTFALYSQYLPTITLEEVNQLAKNWVTKENRVVVITGPEKEGAKMPEEKAVLKLLDKVDQTPVEAYVDQVLDVPLMDNIPAPAAITSEQTFESVGITELTLANGVKVVLKPTDFKNDEILVTAFSPGGHSLYSDQDYYNAVNADAVIDESGLGPFDLVQLQKYMAGKTVGISPYIGELFEGFNGSAAPKDLETLFQMAYLYCTAPKKDPDALQSFSTKQQSIYKNLMSNPNYFFQDTLMKTMYGDNMRRGFPKTESFVGLSLDRMEEIYKERFGDAGDFTFIFVGSFKVEEIKPLIATYLGNLPSNGRKENWKDLGLKIRDGAVDLNLAKGAAPKTLVNMTYHGECEWSEDNSYVFNSMVDLLRIKMRESMREDKGGVYGVQVSGSIDQFPRSKYSLTISFNCDPGRSQELIETALNDIATVQASGAAEKDLIKIKETQRQGWIKSLKENRFWMSSLGAYYRQGLSVENLSEGSYNKKIDGLTSEAIQKAAQLYCNPKQLIRAVMTPENFNRP